MGGRVLRIAAVALTLLTVAPVVPLARRGAPVLLVGTERVRLEREVVCESTSCLEAKPIAIPADHLAFLRFRRPAQDWVVVFTPVGRDAVEQPEYRLEGTRTDLRTPRVGGRYRLDVRPASAPPEQPSFSVLIHASLPQGRIIESRGASRGPGPDPWTVLLVAGLFLVALPALLIAFSALFVSSVGMVLTATTLGVRRLWSRIRGDRRERTSV